jgi:hypothetical protein
MFGLNLTTSILMASNRSVAEPVPLPDVRRGRERRLHFNNVAGYEPRTDIRDQAAVDLDQAVIEKLIDFGLEDSARAIYELGGNSQSVARIRLSNADPPRLTIPKGTKAVGRSTEGHLVEATLIEDVVWADSSEEVVLPLEYIATENQTFFCRLGGLAALDSADLSGCFAAEGIIQILDFQKGAPLYHFNYTYDAFADTHNGRTIQSFSTEIDMSFGDSIHLKKFFTYYNAHDYADRWIQAALDARSTDFLNGNADFSRYGPQSRTEALRVATKLMNFFMHVVRMMELANFRCEMPCGTRCDDTPIRAWDQAVAFYSGSLEGTNGEGGGVLLYDLADRMCAEFKTCSTSGDLDEGTSFINLEIMRLFALCQLQLMRRDCAEAKGTTEQIISLMTVPLVQVNLYSAHIRNFTVTFEEVKSATYAASILPIVHHCSRDDAATIYSNLGLMQSKGGIDVVAIKSAFEQNYGCMGITCKLVGGVWEGSTYGRFAAPCEFREKTKNPDSPAIIAIVVLACACLAAWTIYVVVDRRKKKNLSRLRNRFPHQDPHAINNTNHGIEGDILPGDLVDMPTINLD